MSKVKVTIGYLRRALPKVIEKNRLAMEHACCTKKEKLGWFKSKTTAYPLEDSEVYWKVMQTFYPWNELAGMDYLIYNGNTLSYVYISGQLASRILEDYKSEK